MNLAAATAPTHQEQYNFLVSLEERGTLLIDEANGRAYAHYPRFERHHMFANFTRQPNTQTGGVDWNCVQRVGPWQSDAFEGGVELDAKYDMWYKIFKRRTNELQAHLDGVADETQAWKGKTMRIRVVMDASGRGRSEIIND